MELWCGLCRGVGTGAVSLIQEESAAAKMLLGGWRDGRNFEVRRRRLVPGKTVTSGVVDKLNAGAPARC